MFHVKQFGEARIMEEVWKDILGYEGKYQVSSLGRVKSLNYRGTGQDKLMRLAPTTNGYLQVGLCKDGKMKYYKIHRLVAQAFIENPTDRPCLDHINTMRTDNRADNLRWVTHKENNNNPLTRERLRISNIGKNTGNQNGAKKVFCENTLYDSIKQCAEHYNVNRKTMNHWLTGKNKMPADFQAKGLRYYIEKENDK